MKTSIDALVLIGHANKISHEVPGFVTAHITDQLTTLRGAGHSELHDTTTESDMNNLLAAETFLSLGSLVTSRFVGVPIARKYPNHFRDTAIDIIDEISPFQKGTVLDPEVSKFLTISSGVTEEQTKQMFATAVGGTSEDMDLFRQKWLKSVELFKRRGEVLVKMYLRSEILNAIETKLIDSVPDSIETMSDDENEKYVYQVDSIINNNAVPLHDVLVPYYSIFRQNNATEMYADAVIDLRELGSSIREINTQNEA